MSADYKCPKCGGIRFKTWKLPHPLLLHWILNPGLAFNEVVLGQRHPKLLLICKDCEGNQMDRAYVPCPSCHTMHWGRRWGGKRAFGNWRGVACPTCGASIPCLWNLFSLLLLAIASPIWVLPYYLYFRPKPLKPIYESPPGVLPKPIAITKKTWILMGAAWGSLMWVVMSLLPALWLMSKGQSSWMPIVVGLPVWAFGGLAFGFLMWLFLGRKRQRTDRGEPDSTPSR